VLFRNWFYLSNRLTEAERALEPAIAALGERYRAQWLFLNKGKGAKPYVADFVLLDRNLIIEVDGDSHSEPEQIAKDLHNSMAMQALGYRTVRVSNASAKADPEGTVQAALLAPQTTRQEYEAQVSQLLLDYPFLLAAPSKKSKSAPSPAPKKAKGRGGRSNKR